MIASSNTFWSTEVPQMKVKRPSKKENPISSVLISRSVNNKPATIKAIKKILLLISFFRDSSKLFYECKTYYVFTSQYQN